MNCNKPGCFIFIITIGAALTSQAEARPIAEFNQQIGSCSAQSDKAKRSQCFERLAKDAVAELEMQRTVAVAAPAIQEQDKPKAGKYADIVAKAKANITSGFKDPGSVQWQNLALSGGGGVMAVLCGELNAKNSYGAYVGFKRFYAVADISSLKQIDDEPALSYAFTGRWEAFCEKDLEKVM